MKKTSIAAIKKAAEDQEAFNMAIKDYKKNGDIKVLDKAKEKLDRNSRPS